MRLVRNFIINYLLVSCNKILTQTNIHLFIDNLKKLLENFCEKMKIFMLKYGREKKENCCVDLKKNHKQLFAKSY